MPDDLSRLLGELILARAEHREVSFRGADLEHVDLRPYVPRIGFGLVEADLGGLLARRMCAIDLDLGGADLRGADMCRADLRGVSFAGSCLAGATLAGADLRDAIFWDADLRGVDLQDATTEGSSWIACDLRGADCRGAGLSRSLLHEHGSRVAGTQGLFP